jgi:hypothetical protein
LDIDKSGSPLTFNPTTTNHYGYTYDGSDYAELGSEGLHNVEWEQDGGNNALSFYAIDYHCPVYNIDQWRTNPEPDRLIDGQGTIDNRKFVAVDEKPVQRKIQVCQTLLIVQFLAQQFCFVEWPLIFQMLF